MITGYLDSYLTEMPAKIGCAKPKGASKKACCRCNTTYQFSHYDNGYLGLTKKKDSY